mgnify:CR=1 FL=1
MLLLGINLKAQKIGIKAGANFQTFMPDYAVNEPDYKFRVGWNIGITTKFNLSEKFSFQPGLIYNSKGTSLDDPSFGSDDFIRSAYTYLELPLHIGYDFNDKFFGYAGPYIALGLGGDTYGMIDDVKIEKTKFVPESGTVNAGDLADDEVPYQLFDYGFNFGFGYNFSEKSAVTLDFSLGMRNINNEISDGVTITRDADDVKDFHRGVSISYIFYFKRQIKEYEN